MLACLVGLPARAQTGLAAVDSASVARAEWNRAVAAFNAHDVGAAQRALDHAVSAWPTQPTYVWARAVTAHLAHDTAGVLSALERYAALGLGADLRGNERLAAYAALPAFAALVARLDSNRAVAARSHVVATLRDSTFWPEGVDHDPVTGNYYLTSVRHRTIAEVPPGKPPRELWPRDLPGMGAVLAVRVDPRRRVLWATLAGIPQMHGFTAADSTIAALVRVRIADGTIEQRWDLPPAPLGHVLGDIAIGPLGDVFLTDSKDPVLYRLRAGGDSLEEIRSPFFRSLQGVAPLPNGKALYVADYAHGLLRVDLATKAVSRVDDAPGTTSLGCDGIVWDGEAIIAIQNGVAPARVMRFVLDRSGRRIVSADLVDRNLPVADEPTIGTIVGHEFVYVANSQWEKFTDDGQRRPARLLADPILLAVPLSSRGARP